MPITNRRISVRQISILTFLLCLFVSVFTNAQSTMSYTTNKADSNLRGSLEVDPSTLGMSFNLPMGGYGGRGATLPISLTYSSKIWRLNHHSGFTGYNYYIDQIEAKYSEQATSGWTSSTSVPYIEYTGTQEVYDEVGNPLCTTCDYTDGSPQFFVARVLLHLPDGSTHELRRYDNYYNSFSSATFANSGVYSGIFKSVDGSRINYNFDNSTIYLPDGSRYWLAAPGGVQYFDRNGNTLTFNTSSNQWTDTLGRTISAIPLNNGAVGDLNYLIPGVGGVNQKFILRWKKLGDAGVLTTAQPLRFKGNLRWWAYNPNIGISPYLFGNVSDTQQRICDGGLAGTEFNPVVLNEIVLPNGLS
jgi:hypothetical protein